MAQKNKLQRLTGGTTAENCCVPLCEAYSKHNTDISFHSAPAYVDIRKKWTVAIRRERFTVTDRTRVCSRHFTAEDFRETTGRRLLKKGVVPNFLSGIHFPFHHKDRGFGKGESDQRQRRTWRIHRRRMQLTLPVTTTTPPSPIPPLWILLLRKTNHSEKRSTA